MTSKGAMWPPCGHQRLCVGHQDQSGNLEHETDVAGGQSLDRPPAEEGDTLGSSSLFMETVWGLWSRHLGREATGQSENDLESSLLFVSEFSRRGKNIFVCKRWHILSIQTTRPEYEKSFFCNIIKERMFRIHFTPDDKDSYNYNL